MPLKVTRDEQTSINLTPLIDIVFLLIIFFMVGTRFSELNDQEKQIPLNVPTVQPATALTPAPQKRVINVMDDGAIRLDDRMVTLEQLRSELTANRQQFADLGVIIRGDASVQFQAVADVIAACKTARISDLGIAVRTADRDTAGQPRWK